MKKDIIPELNGKDYIKELNKTYNIMFCPLKMVEKLVDFLKYHWKSDHIFVKSRELLDWQHLDKKNNRYNFVIAVEKSSGEIHSVLGFVPNTQYDVSLQKIQVYPCIWKSREDIKIKGLGVALYYYLKSQLNIETISILGISEIALGIYKHWNFETGKINHYYIVNEKIQDFKLLVNPYKIEEVTHDVSKKMSFVSIHDFFNIPEDFFEKCLPYKSKEYYINRYYKHPIYKYEAFAITEGKLIKGIVFLRSCRYKESTALRVVDFIGSEDALLGTYNEMQNLLHVKKAEYLDFINVGLDSELLKKCGFSLKDSSKTIIPNYYEPFVQKNIDLDYAFKTVNSERTPLFYKGDADQDRPNYIVM